MFSPPCLPAPTGEPWASALTHSGWCGDYAMASGLFLCCLHPTPFRQGLGHQMARGRCCERNTDPFAAATSLAPFPPLPSGRSATRACKEWGAGVRRPWISSGLMGGKGGLLLPGPRRRWYRHVCPASPLHLRTEGKWGSGRQALGEAFLPPHV